MIPEAGRLTFSTLVCPSWSLDHIVESASQHGYRGIDFRGIGDEIDITRLPAFNEELQTTLAELGKRNLTMPCLNMSVTLVCPAPDRWQTMLDETTRYAKLANNTGAKFLRIFGGGVPKEMTREEARVLAIRHLRQLVKICKPHHCLPILETHDDWATSEQVLSLLHEFDPAEVGVLWDTEHPWRRGEPPADTARGLKRYIRHAHLKDSRLTDGKSLPTLVGEGELPMGEFAKALADIEYAGWFCLETEKRWHPTAPEPEESLPQFARFMRERWGK